MLLASELWSPPSRNCHPGYLGQKCPEQRVTPSNETSCSQSGYAGAFDVALLVATICLARASAAVNASRHDDARQLTCSATTSPTLSESSVQSAWLLRQSSAE